MIENAFGGEEALKKSQKRDSIKKDLCDMHDIKLVYILFSNKINEHFIRELLLQNNIELKIFKEYMEHSDDSTIVNVCQIMRYILH